MFLRNFFAGTFFADREKIRKNVKIKEPQKFSAIFATFSLFRKFITLKINMTSCRPCWTSGQMTLYTLFYNYKNILYNKMEAGIL